MGGLLTMHFKTWLDLVREYFPDATDEEGDYILWEHTAFPFASVKHIEMQIAKYRFLQIAV